MIMKSKNPVNWFEIYVDDMDRAKKFYEIVFDIELIKMPMPEGMNAEMCSFPWEEGGINATGALVKTKEMKAGGNSVLVYFTTDECLAEQNKVEKAGGKIKEPKFPIGEYGFCALCIDTEGNIFGLHSTK